MALPFRLARVVDGHENGIFTRLADAIQLSKEKLDQLRFVLGGNDGQTIDDDEGI